MQGFARHNPRVTWDIDIVMLVPFIGNGYTKKTIYYSIGYGKKRDVIWIVDRYRAYTERGYLINTDILE